MKYASQIGRVRLIVISTTICASILAAGLWRSNALQGKARSNALRDLFRKGLGREVKFATATNSVEQIRASVKMLAVALHKKSSYSLV
jgi:hypothetical protein